MDGEFVCCEWVNCLKVRNFIDFGYDRCDGQDVRPWVVDVTQSLVMDGPNIITYFATQAGIPPNLTYLFLLFRSVSCS